VEAGGFMVIMDFGKEKGWHERKLIGNGGEDIVEDISILTIKTIKKIYIKFDVFF